MKQTSATFVALAALLPSALASLPAYTDTCGAVGWDKVEGYEWFRNKGSYRDCSAACLKDSKNCKSFSFSANECNLYTVPLADNFVLDTQSPYHFFDASCIGTWSTTTSSATATKPATTTTVSQVTTTTISVSQIPSYANTTVSTSSTQATSSSEASHNTTTTILPTTLITMTSKATSTSTTITSASSTSQTPSCPLPTWIVSDFVFFNSSHNLDCAGVDFNNELCYTGKPPQPELYGPPDSITASISDIGACAQRNPGTTPRRAVGSDVVRCGGSAYQFAFYGNSNSAISIGHFNVQNPFTCPDGSMWSASGSMDFRMGCSYDSGRNATCTALTGTVSVPATQVSCLSGC